MSAVALDSLAAIPGVWRGVGRKRADAESTGDPALDSALLGGWPIGAMTQIVSGESGLGFSLMVPLLARMTGEGRHVALISPPFIPYAPALAERGVALQKLAWIQPKDSTEALWAAEQALRSGVFGAVALWSRPLRVTTERRLQLATEAGRGVAILVHESGFASHSVAAVRLMVSSAPGSLLIDVERCRGSRPGRRLRQSLPLSRVA